MSSITGTVDGSRSVAGLGNPGREPGTGTIECPTAEADSSILQTGGSVQPPATSAESVPNEASESNRTDVAAINPEMPTDTSEVEKVGKVGEAKKILTAEELYQRYGRVLADLLVFAEVHSTAEVKEKINQLNHLTGTEEDVNKIPVIAAEIKSSLNHLHDRIENGIMGIVQFLLEECPGFSEDKVAKLAFEMKGETLADLEIRKEEKEKQLQGQHTPVRTSPSVAQPKSARVSDDEGSHGDESHGDESSDDSDFDPKDLFNDSDASAENEKDQKIKDQEKQIKRMAQKLKRMQKEKEDQEQKNMDGKKTNSSSSSKNEGHVDQSTRKEVGDSLKLGNGGSSTEADASVGALQKMRNIETSARNKLSTAMSSLPKGKDGANEIQKLHQAVGTAQKAVELCQNFIVNHRNCSVLCKSIQCTTKEQSEALKEIASFKRGCSTDKAPLELMPGESDTFGVITLPLLKFYAAGLKSTVLNGTNAINDLAASFVRITNPKLVVVSAGVTVKKARIAKMQDELKMLEKDNIGANETLLNIFRFVQQNKSTGDNCEDDNDSNDGSDDESNVSDEESKAGAIWEKASNLVDNDQDLALGMSHNNILKISSAIVAVTGSMRIVAVNDLTFDSDKGGDVDTFRHLSSSSFTALDSTCTLASLWDKCVSVLSIASTSSDDKKKALCCALAMFSTMNEMKANESFQKAMSVVAGKPAGTPSIVDEVRCLRDEQNAFAADERGKETTNQKHLKSMVRITAMVLMSQFLTDTLNEKIRVPAFDIFSSCLRLSPSYLVQASAIFWDTGILSDNEVSAKNHGTVFKHLSRIVEAPSTKLREEQFGKTVLVMVPSDKYMKDLERIVKLHQ